MIAAADGSNNIGKRWPGPLGAAWAAVRGNMPGPRGGTRLALGAPARGELTRAEPGPAALLQHCPRLGSRAPAEPTWAFPPEEGGQSSPKRLGVTESAYNPKSDPESGLCIPLDFQRAVVE